MLLCRKIRVSVRLVVRVRNVVVVLSLSLSLSLLHNSTHSTHTGENQYGKFELLGVFDFDTNVFEVTKMYLKKPAPKRPVVKKQKVKKADHRTAGKKLAKLERQDSSSSINRPARKRKAPSKLVAIQEEEIELSSSMRKCLEILKSTMRHSFAGPFNVCRLLYHSHNNNNTFTQQQLSPPWITLR